MFNLIKRIFNTIINDTKAECEFHIDPSKFTAEQCAAFDRIVDFLANMVEKYGPLIDKVAREEMTDHTEKITV